VALIPELALSNVRQDIAVRELSPASPARQVLVATAGGAGVPAAATAMVEVVRASARSYESAKRPPRRPGGASTRGVP
jgi:hypothetical protein